MISKVASLVTAECVANLVLNDQRIREARGCIEAYQNGREQGLMVWTHGYKTEAYYICHHRNSDSPFCWYGEYSMQAVSEDAYQKGGISFQTIEQCADWIVERIVIEMT